MSPKTSPSGKNVFVDRVRTLEEKLFPDQLDADDSTRMKSAEYSWYYRPSHHVSTGLITEADIELLSQPGRRLLSVGAHPAYLERLLCDLGVLPENIVIADNDPALRAQDFTFEKRSFDMLQPWPEIGMVDLIIFPESLCIALSDVLKKSPAQSDNNFPTDALEAQLLSRVLAQALERLHTGGEIRSNGPQSHPNVVKMARAKLDAEGYRYELEYERYFLRVRHHD